MNTDKFQGKCLVNSEGWRHMDIYDRLPPDVRLRLQSSTYNLCVVCIYYRRISDDFHSPISWMEAMIRQQEGDLYG